MYNGKRVLGLIPARGGSIRLPRKNLVNLFGKPLIAWTIEAALASETIDDVFVSTEDSEIEQTALTFDGLGVVRRPGELASNQAKSIDVVIHALQELSNQEKEYGYVALLQPTSPLRTSTHIEQGFCVMSAKRARAVIGVCPTEHPMEWMGRLPSSNSLRSFLRNVRDEHSGESAEQSYQINGALYLLEIPEEVSRLEVFPDNQVYAYIMQRKYSIDIDTHIDLVIAEAMFRGVLREK